MKMIRSHKLSFDSYSNPTYEACNELFCVRLILWYLAMKMKPL